MYLILVATVLVVAVGVYSIVYALSHAAVINDVRERGEGVKDYLLEVISSEDFEMVKDKGEDGALARARVQVELSRLSGPGNIRHLYLAWEDEAGEIVTTTDGQEAENGNTGYCLTGELVDKLVSSFSEGVPNAGISMFDTEYGWVYPIVWPVIDARDQQTVVAICMEFDVESIHRAFLNTAQNTLAMTGAFIFMFSVVAYISLGKVTEPFYKKIAYTDILTGFENRMAFEQGLLECEAMIARAACGDISLITFDINNLKYVNDTFGHKQGDIYLKNTANVLAQKLYGLGKLYRIGGDEFASILIGRKQEEISELQKAVREDKTMVLKNREFSCACGVATLRREVDNSLRDVLARADEAMYNEKRRQKGLAQIASATPILP